MRYFLNFYWNRPGSVVAIPGQPVPMPVPMPAIATDMKVSQVSASSGGAAPDIADRSHLCACALYARTDYSVWLD